MPPEGSKSFEELAVPHLEAIYRIARRLTRDQHAAEDLTQETYLKAYKSFASFEMREYGIKPWLLRILHNTYLNRLAQERRAPRPADDSRLGGVQDPAGAAFELSASLRGEHEHLDEEVKRAIDALGPEFRAVLLLWATMELSYQEIAEIVGVPVGTVMSRLHRARQQLLEALSDYAREHRRIPARDQS
jgi:RNA polymerase sigma-70 factor (ECF subfamily)